MLTLNTGINEGKKRKELHPESLLRIPLVREMLLDREFSLKPRRIDQNWFYQKAIPNPVCGFSPYRSEIFYPSVSCMADWLEDPSASARNWNVSDRLWREVLFSVHDYLHAWAARTIQSLRPGAGFGHAPIEKGNLEDFVFYHLLTEAAAVVGLDYWYLGTVDVNAICDLGTRLENLTVNYRESDLKEYHRFNPDLRVQKPEFFSTIAQFYCSGELEGFDVVDMKRSPKLAAWIGHELRYGACQRQYTRSWFAYMSAQKIELTAEALSAPVKCGKAWQKKLMRELGDLLWRKIKHGESIPLEAAPKYPWDAPKNKSPDFRFINLNALDDSELDQINAEEISATSFEFLFYQWLSRHDFESFDVELFPYFEEVLRKRNFAGARALLRGLKPLTGAKGPEARGLFFLP